MYGQRQQVILETLYCHRVKTLVVNYDRKFIIESRPSAMKICRSIWMLELFVRTRTKLKVSRACADLYSFFESLFHILVYKIDTLVTLFLSIESAYFHNPFCSILSLLVSRINEIHEETFFSDSCTPFGSV